ncbi:hypothetical protein VTK73DRAFT_9185 [Phialemonium thermophilum]|uniref:FAS1 domain-containing protein n=1 Tax=Phialemonium thermophilum TaxID=223376 RepID=A0ABR3W3T7_9PEZI
MGPSSTMTLTVLLSIVLAATLYSAGIEAAGERSLGSVLASRKELSTYYDLVKQYPDILLELPSYAGVTVVAPNNKAFSKLQNWDPKNETLVSSLLRYHVLQGTVATDTIPEGPSTVVPTLLTAKTYTNVSEGQNVLISKQPREVVIFTSGQGSRSTLVDGDLSFSGGLIQVVDTLLVPPERLELAVRDAYQDLTAFLGALYAADLVPLFAESPNVTIFAPRNEAFQAVADALESLPRNELVRILRYHLVTGQILSSATFYNSSGPNSTETAAESSFPVSAVLQNSSSSLVSTTTSSPTPVPLHFTRAGNDFYVDTARLVQPDILVANGVVHMIDAVLNPNASDMHPDTTQPTQAPAFAVTGEAHPDNSVSIPFTSALPCVTDCPGPSTAVPSETDSPTTTGAVTSRRTASANGGAQKCKWYR